MREQVTRGLLLNPGVHASSGVLYIRKRAQMRGMELLMCDSRRPLEGADSEPRETVTVPPVDRMVQEWLPEATRWPVWRDRAVNGGWDHPRDSEASDGS